MPLFSVIIPTYNRARLVAATLESVFAQEFTDYEIIVVDDGSTDDTPDVLRAAVDRHGDIVKVIRQENRGVSAARNHGACHAAGTYLAFLDSDDLWFPWTLSAYARSIREHNSPALVMGVPVYFRHESELRAAPLGLAPYRSTQWPDLLARLAKEMIWIGAGGTVLRADMMAVSGGYSTLHINAEDLDFLFRLWAVQGFVHLESPPSFGYRQHAHNRCADSPANYRGYLYVFGQHKAGRYPGGKRCNEVFRHIARQSCWYFLRVGEPWYGLRLYGRTFWLQWRHPRIRYLVGFLLKAVALTLLGGRMGEKEVNN